MIQIESNNLNSIAELHFEACNKYISPRLEFYIDLFNSLGFKKYSVFAKSASDRYNLPDISLKTLINPYLKNEYKRKGHNYNVTSQEIKSVLCTKNNHIIDDQDNLNKFKHLRDFFLLIKNNLESIIKSTPVEINTKIESSIYSYQNDIEAKKGIEIVFSYETLISTGFKLNNGSIWDNYSITAKLNLSVCPYCNRNWINTIKNKSTDGKITSPQLDHFFSKSDYPLFRLSFYNLIPSCETCNSRLKKDIDFKLASNIHPLIEGYKHNVKFITIPRSINAIMGISNDYSIDIDTTNCPSSYKTKIKGNHTVFKINEIYGEHGDIISEVYRKRYIFSDKYLEILQRQFPALGKSKSELYRFAFGNYYDEAEFIKRPFSKLTRDVAEQLGLIK